MNPTGPVNTIIRGVQAVIKGDSVISFSLSRHVLVRANGKKKVTKKGRKNWALQLEECKKMSSLELVNYMKNKKTQLRKLEACYIKGKKQER